MSGEAVPTFFLFVDPREPDARGKQDYIYRYIRTAWSRANGQVCITCAMGDVVRAHPVVWSPTGDPEEDQRMGMVACFPFFRATIVKLVLTYLLDHRVVLSSKQASHESLLEFWRCAHSIRVYSLAKQILRLLLKRFPEKGTPRLETRRRKQRKKDAARQTDS